nr:PVC-type heme-binding CxxCH protein [Pedobacter panaciterrae]
MRKAFFLLLISCLLFQNCSNKTRMSGAVQEVSSFGKESPRRTEVLFLGNTSTHHDSGKYAPWLAIELFKSGINLTYTTDLKDLNTENLNKYDGLIIYANHDTISSSQEQALKGFVESGKGLIPLHSASGCFKNSEWYVKAIGGQFASHGKGSFTAQIVNPSHQIMENIPAFTTTDETYVHQKLNSDIVVLTERTEGSKKEPYTWVRNEGKGRVFYTAYGHHDATWKNGSFLKLVRNGVLWAIGDNVKDQIARLKIPDVSIYSDTIADFTARHLVPKIQEGLTPEESMKLIQVPADFEIKLFAAEPDITNPIAMAWDERGRLWIVESVDYPNTFIETDGAANDRIKICEDTDGDGKADKFTIFADSLNIPTSIVFANDGVIISQAPNMVFLKDTNGDDKADIHEIISTGWGKNDTHAGPSNLQYGFDNKIWGVVGFSGFNGQIDGVNTRFGQGVYRFKPDGEDFEYLAPTSNNTWGLGFSEENNVFISTANNTHSAFYSMPASYTRRTLPGLNLNAVQKIDGHYDAHSMTPNLRQVDVVGGFTSAAGHHLYTARNFPKNYWNRIAFISEPTVKLIHNAIIEPDGAGFKEKDGWNFLASSDEWVGPVQAEVGPDGAVWVADWYNFVIQHNTFVPRQSPTEFILPLTLADQKLGQGNALISNLRDLDRGRIYRVIYKKAEPYAPVSLSKNNTSGLIAALESDNLFWRLTAQRLLVEKKDQSAIPALLKLIANQKVDEIGLNGPAVNALWTLHGMGVLEGKNANATEVVVQALSHPAAGVRKAAIEVLPKNNHTVHMMQSSGVLNDRNLNTRMAAILTLVALPASQGTAKIIYDASFEAENEKDPWLTQALFAAALKNRDGFLSISRESGKKAKDSSLNQRLVNAASQEIYILDRSNSSHLSPDVKGKEIHFKAIITKAKNEEFEGVIIAQGNKENGYCLFIQSGNLNMLVNQNGKSYKAVTKDSVPNRSFEVIARLEAGGIMTLEINNRTVASAKAPGLFKNALSGGLRIGVGKEGDGQKTFYNGMLPLKGDIKNASLELKKVNPSENKIDASVPAIRNDDSRPMLIKIKVVKDLMQYDKNLFTVKAGQKLIFELENPDGMQHNMLIIKPGTLQKVGKAADDMLRDPQAAQKSYVPNMPEVLHATKLLNTGDVVTFEFTVPGVTGDYPFLCTFPGHWRGMNGIMRVIK